jgi:hypothetical protein
MTRVTYDLVCEGVIIPKRHALGEAGQEGDYQRRGDGEVSDAVFAETLNGKIILPKPNSGIGVPSRILNGLEQKLRRDYRSVSKEWGTSKDLAGPRSKNRRVLKKCVPQRLKPRCEQSTFGTAEAVPLSKTDFFNSL